MDRQPEQFMVVALSEHRKRHTAPALRMPQHILLASLTSPYRPQTAYWIDAAVKGQGVRHGEIVSAAQVSGNHAWEVKGESINALQQQVLDAALSYDMGTTAAQPSGLYLTAKDNEIYVPGDAIPPITEISVVGWIGAGLVVYKNIPLEPYHEAET